MKLLDKVALVTGAGKGIGNGVARYLAQEGAHVVLNYAHSAEGAEAMCVQIRALGRKALAIKANIAKADEVKAMFDQTLATLGPVDILVNNAGVDPHVDFLQMTEEQWDWTIDTNLKGNFLCSQAAARQMVQTGGGKIIIISSIHSIQTYPHITAYAASKGGLNAMTRQLALELAPYHINVNCVAPGAVHVEKFYGIIPDYDPHMFDHEIPLGFIGLPADIGAAVAFFASEEAKYVTGQVLFVDGGTAARMFLGVTEKKPDQYDSYKTLQKHD